MSAIPLLPYSLNAAAGWWGFLCGAATGALMGLCFHRETWLGGYGSFQRRLLRLGHIACFGVGLLNLLFALSITTVSRAASVSSVLLLVAMVAMPLTCFATAWRAPFRHLFFIPAGSLLAALLLTALHLS